MKHRAKSPRAIVIILPKLAAFFLIFPSVLHLSGCATSLYLAKLGLGQAKIVLHSRSVDSVLKDSAIEDSLKDKIELSIEAKTYGEKEIGLVETSNFSKFYQVEGSSLLYVVSACPKDRLESYQWWFPITGRVTAKGFFSYEDAIRESEKLEGKGLDVFIQGAQAYSTLGWFRDPIFSTTLHHDPAIIVNVIIHELTHNTVFFKNHLDFNEQIAFFVGGQGAIDFTGTKFGVGSHLQKRAIGILEDGVLFGRFINGVFEKLRILYSQSVSWEVKVQQRESVFREAKKEFKALKERFKTDFYLEFEKVTLNNAAVLAFGRYVADIEQIRGVYERLDRDLRRTVEFFKDIEKAGIKNPQGYVTRWLEKKKSDESISPGRDGLVSSL
jgi:predicted aminopeptidase